MSKQLAAALSYYAVNHFINRSIVFDFIEPELSKAVTVLDDQVRVVSFSAFFAVTDTLASAVLTNFHD